MRQSSLVEGHGIGPVQKIAFQLLVTLLIACKIHQPVFLSVVIKTGHIGIVCPIYGFLILDI
jgi:hypothetical protein